jgi:hypothetical protein
MRIYFRGTMQSLDLSLSEEIRKQKFLVAILLLLPDWKKQKRRRTRERYDGRKEEKEICEEEREINKEYREKQTGRNRDKVR